MMPGSLSEQLGELCRKRRIDLDISQDDLARAIGVSRGYIAVIESGRANPTLAVTAAIGNGLGLQLTFSGGVPAVASVPQRDLVHARCSSYVQRRLAATGFDCRREVAFSDGRVPGWMDLLAFNPSRRVLIVIEIKTILDDIGAVERQVAWYERHARRAAADAGWSVRELYVWVLALETDDVERAIRANREALRQAFPSRASDMLPILGGAPSNGQGGAAIQRGLALIDPRSRRAAWLVPSRSEGRRSPAPYRGYADAVARLARTQR